MRLFDSHCHLDFEALSSALDGHLDEARSAGVRGWFVPGIRPEQWARLALVARDDVWLGVGLHPWETDHAWDVDAIVGQLRESAVQLGAVALGECGLDQFRGGSIERQIELFEAQLKLAREMELPLVLHQVGQREAFLRAIERVGLSESGGVVHGYGGDAAFARALVNRGLLLGVGVSVTFENRKKLRSAVSEMELERLVLETDAPDQKPQGIKKSPQGAERFGVPADILAVCGAVAALTGSSPEVVAETTYRTACDLFRLPKD